MSAVSREVTDGILNKALEAAGSTSHTNLQVTRSIDADRESLARLRDRLSGDPMDVLATVQDGVALNIVFNELVRFGFTETAAEVFLMNVWARGVQVVRRHG